MDILDCCDICGQGHATELCPELGLNVSQVELDVLSTRARLTLPNQFHIADNGNGLVGVIATGPIPAKTQFGPFEAKRTTHIFDDTGFFTLKLICKDGSTICLDTTDENECNWMCLVRAALSPETQNCMAYQLGTNIFFSTTREITAGEELQVWYAPHFALKLRKLSVPDGESKVLLGHRIEPLAVHLEPDVPSHEQKYGQLSEDHNEEDVVETPAPARMEIIKAFYCPRCGHTFPTQTTMVQHLREHVLAATLKTPVIPGQKRGRGRPRMTPMIVSAEPKRGRGRPRKNSSLPSTNGVQVGLQRKRKREEEEEEKEEEEFHLEDLDEDDDENEVPKDADDTDMDAVIDDTEYSPFKDLTSAVRRIQPRRKRKGQNSWLIQDYVVSKIDLENPVATAEVVNGTNTQVGSNDVSALKNCSKVSGLHTNPVKRRRGRPRKVKDLVENIAVKDQTKGNENKQAENDPYSISDSTKTSSSEDTTISNNNDLVSEGNVNMNSNNVESVINKTNSIEIARTDELTNGTSSMSVTQEHINQEKEIHVEFIRQQDGDSGIALDSEAVIEYQQGVVGESLNESVHVVITTCTDSISDSSTTEQGKVDNSINDIEGVRTDHSIVVDPGVEKTFFVQPGPDENNTIEIGKEVDLNRNRASALIVNDNEKLIRNGIHEKIENSTESNSDENNESSDLNMVGSNNKSSILNVVGENNESSVLIMVGENNESSVLNIVGENNENSVLDIVRENNESSVLNMVGENNEDSVLSVVGENQVSVVSVVSENNESHVTNPVGENNESLSMIMIGENNESSIVNEDDENEAENIIGENNESSVENENADSKSNENTGGNILNETNAYVSNNKIAETENDTTSTMTQSQVTQSQDETAEAGPEINRETATAVEEITENNKKEVMKMLEQAGTEEYCCMLCGEKFQTEGEALSHFMNHSCRTDKARATQSVANSTEDLDAAPKGSKGKTKDANKDYTCDICHQAFTTPQYLYRHMVMHTDMFTCVKCKKTFSRKDSMQKHVLKCCPQLADNYRIYACKTCSRVFSTSSGYKKHVKKCVSVQCETCQKVFNTNTDLEKHKCEKIKDMSLAGRFSCGMCPKMFQSQYYLKQHILLHDKLFTCSHCGKTLPTQEEKDEHTNLCITLQEIKNNGSGNCEKCDETFINSKLFREHYLSHSHPYKCDICLRRFVKVGTLSSHDCQVDPGSHVCKVCNKSFKSALNLTRHTQEQGCSRYECSACNRQFYKKALALNHVCCLAVNGQVKIIAKTDFHEICMKCGKTFTTKSNLNKHMLIHGEKKFQCIHCYKQFHLKVYLKEHIACVHYNLYKYQCNHCGKMLRSKTGLITHNKLLHSDNVETYPCTECDKVFKQKINLKQHMISHSSERKYSCKECSKTFKYPDQLCRHRFEHRDVKKLECPNEMCEKTFYRQCELKKHIEIYHSGYLYVCDVCEARCSHRHTIVRHYKRKHPHKFHLLSQEGYVDKLYKHYNDLYPDDIITDGIVMQNQEVTEQTDPKLTTSTEALSHTAAQALHSMALGHAADAKKVLHQQQVDQMVSGLMPNIPTVSVEAGALVPSHDNTLTINNLQAIMPTVEGIDTTEGQIVILQIVDPEGQDLSAMVPGEIIQQLQVQAGDFIQSIQGLSGQSIQPVGESNIITVTQNKLSDSEDDGDNSDKANVNDLEQVQGQGQVIDVQLPVATHNQNVEISDDLEMQNLIKKEIDETQANNPVEQTEVALIEHGNELNIQEMGGVEG